MYIFSELYINQAHIDMAVRFILKCLYIYYLHDKITGCWLVEKRYYFINCTDVQLMILPKQTKWRKAT